jgi:hypothetical protein
MTKVTFEISRQNQSDNLLSSITNLASVLIEIKFVSEQPEEILTIKLGHLQINGKGGSILSINLDQNQHISNISALGYLTANKALNHGIIDFHSLSTFEDHEISYFNDEDYYNDHWPS